jgi:hypothetical protein
VVLDVEDLTLGVDVNRGPDQLKGVIDNQGGVNVHEQKVTEEVLVMEVQLMDIELHMMARDHVPLDGEKDEE